MEDHLSCAFRCKAPVIPSYRSGIIGAFFVLIERFIMAQKTEWCLRVAKSVNWLGFTKDPKAKMKKQKIPNKITCPDCKRRLKPRVRQCDDTNCWHVCLPAHKTKK